MRRSLTLVAVLLLVMGLAGASALAQDDSAPLVLYGEETTSTIVTATGQVDPPEDDPTAFTPGTRFLSIDAVYSDAERTNRVGRNDIMCTVLEVTGQTEADFGATVSCHGVVTLDGQGQLSWAGSVTFAGGELPDPQQPFATVAITGGTGAFVAAGGEVDIFELEGATEDEVLSRYEVFLLDLR